MAVLIDKRELLRKARQRRLPLAMIEKDYVLGWVLYGLRQVRGMVFKGGTALAKVYFPEMWRLSEDLDYVVRQPSWDRLLAEVSAGLETTSRASGIELRIRSTHSNPGYLQLKVQYAGLLGKNWLKIDVTPEPPIGRVLRRQLSRGYSDYPKFTVRVESLEEIMAQKLRALVERKKVRDYYDVWRMLELDIDRAEVRRLFRLKLEAKGIRWEGMRQIFPLELAEVLTPYWERELARLVYPVPDMGACLDELRKGLTWLR